MSEEVTHAVGGGEEEDEEEMRRRHKSETRVSSDSMLVMLDA